MQNWLNSGRNERSSTLGNPGLLKPGSIHISRTCLEQYLVVKQVVSVQYLRREIVV